MDELLAAMYKVSVQLVPILGSLYFVFLFIYCAIASHLLRN